MTEKYRALLPGDLTRLPPPCPRCGRPPTSRDAGWVVAASRELGLCGVTAHDGDAIVGHLLLAASDHVPSGVVPLATQDVSAVLLRVQVAAEHRGTGLGRAMVQFAAARLPVRHLDAVSTSDVTCATPPVEWLAACGFRPLTATPQHQVHRLDTASAVRWRQLGETAWERLGRLLPKPVVAPPEPAGRDSCHTLALS